jgi:hypothetical protein
MMGQHGSLFRDTEASSRDGSKYLGKLPALSATQEGPGRNIDTDVGFRDQGLR